jgi:4'-phosphopantetheinyl transferase EntD
VSGRTLEPPVPSLRASGFGAALLGGPFETAGWVRAEELALLGGDAVAARRREFCLGRAAARLALRRAGGPDATIWKGAGGQPIWPPGWVGSITHTRGTAAAVVAPASGAAGVGVDMEDLSGELRAGVEEVISLPSERTWIGRGPGAERRTKILFSAKEAAFKAFFPLAGVFLGFQDVELRWEAASSAYAATLLRTASPAHPAGSTFEVVVQATADRVLTCTLLAPAASARHGAAPPGGAARAAVDLLAAAVG